MKTLQKNGLVDSERNIVPEFEYQKLKYKIKKSKQNYINRNFAGRSVQKSIDEKEGLKETKETVYTQFTDDVIDKPADVMNDVRYFNRRNNPTS